MFFGKLYDNVVIANKHIIAYPSEQCQFHLPKKEKEKKRKPIQFIAMSIFFKADSTQYNQLLYLYNYIATQQKYIIQL